jgi:hypothetical protein
MNCGLESPSGAEAWRLPGGDYKQKSTQYPKPETALEFQRLFRLLLNCPQGVLSSPSRRFPAQSAARPFGALHDDRRWLPQAQDSADFTRFT